MALYKFINSEVITEELLTRALVKESFDNYRDFEDALFNAMKSVKWQGGCAPSFIKKLSGAPLNRLGYLLSMLSIPVQFEPDNDAPVVALYWKNNEPDAQANRLDEVAGSWRLSKGIELSRWKQFLSSGMC